MGLRPGEVAARAGYSLGRVSVLSADPAFKELVASYRESVNEEWKESVDEYFGLVVANRTMAARLLNDKLQDADPDDVTFGQLVAIHADAADRSGYPKRTVAVNVNCDFAAQLDRAIARSAQAKILDLSPNEAPVPVCAEPQPTAEATPPGLDSPQSAPLRRIA